MKTEKAIQDEIMKYLKDIGAWVLKVHGGPYQTVGIPDLLVCYQGRFFGMEVKREKEKLTPIQEHIIEQIQSSGGVAGRVESLEEAIGLLSQPLSADFAGGFVPPGAFFGFDSPG